MGREILAQALMSCSKGDCAACLYRGEGMACKKKLMARAASHISDGMNRQDYLLVWGMMQALKDVYESRAKDANRQGGEAGAQVAANYHKTIEEISALQEKISREADMAGE